MLFFVQILALLLQGLSTVTYQVFPAAMNPTCDASKSSSKPGNKLPDKAAIGSCHDFGKGKSAHNSIEILGCSAKCLCFKQYASQSSNPTCNQTKALGYNVKESCFDQCKADCNGINCGETATLQQTRTRLRLLGSGQICADQKPEADYSCATTGMVKPVTSSSTSAKPLTVTSSSTSATGAVTSKAVGCATSCFALLVSFFVVYV